MRNPKILVFSGSTRGGSYNRMLAALAAKQLAILDADVTHVSLKDYALPIYDGDLEDSSGVPENARKLHRLFTSQDAVFIACPEYNAGVTPLLKNTLDWISRVSDPSDAYKNRIFALGAASPGGFGGMRGLIGMRTILEVGLGASVLPQMVAIQKAANAFDEKGNLVDERVSGQLEKLTEALIRTARLHMAR